MAVSIEDAAAVLLRSMVTALELPSEELFFDAEPPQDDALAERGPVKATTAKAIVARVRDRNSQYIGGMLHGRRHGLGFYQSHNFNYLGYHVDGQRRGFGIASIYRQIYFGEWLGNQPWGKGCTLDPDTNVRTFGVFDDGVLRGHFKSSIATSDWLSGVHIDHTPRSPLVYHFGGSEELLVIYFIGNEVQYPLRYHDCRKAILVNVYRDTVDPLSSMQRVRKLVREHLGSLFVCSLHHYSS